MDLVSSNTRTPWTLATWYRHFVSIRVTSTVFLLLINDCRRHRIYGRAFDCAICTRLSPAQRIFHHGTHRSSASSYTAPYADFRPSSRNQLASLLSRFRSLFRMIGLSCTLDIETASFGCHISSYPLTILPIPLKRPESTF